MPWQKYFFFFFFFLHDARCNIPASLPTYLLGPPVRELTHAATAYLDVGLTSDPRPRHRHQPADLSNGPPLFLWPMELSPLNWNMAAKHTEASQLGSRKKSEWHNEPRLIRVRFICRPPVCLPACLPAALMPSPVLLLVSQSEIRSNVTRGVLS